MKTNVGNADRIIRFILGVAILALGFYFKSWWGLVGVVPIITGLLNFCPVYSLIGVSTKKKIETEKLKI
jgi:hypothetical protein